MRRPPAEVLNVMITTAAKSKKVKTVIWMRIVRKTEHRLKKGVSVSVFVTVI